MIVLDELMNHPIPEARQRLTKRDAILYALSVGVGQDPIDPRQLDFVDHRKPLRPMPSQAIVMAHPGFWMSDPKTGIDAVRLVHGEQGLILHRLLPVEGEVISRSRVDRVVDKGPGKGALLYTSKLIVDARTEELLATTESTVFLRGDGGFGGPSGPVRAPNPIPDTEPDHVVELATRPEQALYYCLNGDDNPLHSDPVVAERAGFPRPILHGLCTFGVVCHALLRTVCDYDPSRLARMNLRFSAPVMPGETIRTEIWASGAFRAKVVERDTVVLNNGAFALASA